MLRVKTRPTRLFFAADLHGSQPTFRKFINAAKFYETDVLIFGGDLMGKALVPIVKEDGRFRARMNGDDHDFDADGMSEFTRAAEMQGFYWKVLDRDEYEAARSDPFSQRGMWQELASARLQEWLTLAEERLAGTGVKMYLTGGNDDEPAVLETLDRHDGENVMGCEGRLVQLDDEHTMITVGLSTFTPWDTPREASEEEIARAIEEEVSKVPDIGRAVFNFHCPPKDTPIDTCVKLRPAESPDEMPKPIRQAGRFVMIGGGSKAVRDAVSEYQPLLGLHGHIHESGGRFRMRKTQCFNPGSEYLQGTLQGWILAIKDGKLTGYQHTAG